MVIPLFGLTGGIASGKSTVASFFAALGAKVIDADQIARELLRSPGPAFDEVVSRFGGEMVNPAGEIDRKKMAAIIFSDAARRRELESILHPRIIKRQENLAAEFFVQNPKAVVLVDAALIFEAGIQGRFNQIIVTWCTAQQQIERAMAKAGLSREQAMLRVSAQMPVEEKRRRADYEIDCSGTLEETRKQVESLHPRLLCLISP